MAPQKKGEKQQNNTRKKKRIYTEEELHVPKLNTVAKPAAIKKRKKGKVFVEDPATLLSILAQVNNAKEGQIRSKLERVKDLEEVRERKRLEIEKKERSKAAVMEKKKAELKSGGVDRTSAAAAPKVPQEEGKKRFYGDYRNKKKRTSDAD